MVVGLFHWQDTPLRESAHQREFWQQLLGYWVTLLKHSAWLLGCAQQWRDAGMRCRTLRVVFGVLTSRFHVWDGNHWIVLWAPFSAKAGCSCGKTN
jgi:hypothetical protein